MNQLLVILGPTATGKTDIALHLAKIFNGELIAADSRQVYKGLDIGTGKLPGSFTDKIEEKLTYGKKVGEGEYLINNKVQKEEGLWVYEGVKVWMYDKVFPTKQYHVAQYIDDANQALKKIYNKKKLPIIIGGTGLYIKGLIYGLSNLSVPINLSLRQGLEKMALAQLQEKLISLSPTVWESLHKSDRKNPRRLIRKIELVCMNPYKSDSKVTKSKIQKFNVLKIGLGAPRPYIYGRINSRVYDWLDQGIIEEVSELKKQGVSSLRFHQLGLEHGLLSDFIDGKIKDRQKLIDLMQTKVRQYAKRQITWFKKEEGVEWFDVSEKGWQEKVEKKVLDWYNKRS